MNSKNLLSLIQKARKEGYPPSLQIKVQKNGRVVFDLKSGKAYQYYDVASLTKIMVTVPLMMQLYEKKAYGLNDSIGSHLGFLKGHRVGKIKIQDLLRHSSGLTWWRPYYKNLMIAKPATRSRMIKEVFAREKVKPQAKCVYSDLDFILLGWLIEELTDMKLNEAAFQNIFKPLRMKNTFFNPAVKKSLFAPTSKTKLRGVVQGVVDDDNAWAMGGVAGHAGLFSTIDDLSLFGQELLKCHQKKSQKLFKSQTLHKFSKRAVSKNRGDWALGFVIPSKPSSTGGKNISPQSFGHTGFVGTSLWIDTKRNAVVSVLSNRTYPSRGDERFKKLRPQLHDAIWEMLDES